MGCAGSKEKVCKNCKAPYSPVRRSYSMHVHHPSQKSGDSYHLVSLTSSTLGSLKLDPSLQSEIDAQLNQNQNQNQIRVPIEIGEKIERKESATKEEFQLGMIEAKTWSTMIDGKIPKKPPKTPIITPPGEPETINAWEMMEGLEDVSPLRFRPNRFRSFSFHVSSHTSLSTLDDQDQELPTPKVKENVNLISHSSPKPMWLDLADTDSNSNSNDTSIVSEFDPEVIATFRRALEELPATNPFHLNVEPEMYDKNRSKMVESEKEKEPAEVYDKDRSKMVESEKEEEPEMYDKDKSKIAKDKLVVYFTSLRGVRKTYEDCCHVRVILKGLGVKVDERDVSMHSGFKEELKELLGEGVVGIGLPRVFLGKKCVGGAEEVRRLNEEGKLEKLVENCEVVEDGGGGDGCGNGNVCEACGDLRFVPCDTCSGSCKIYYENEDEDEDEDGDESEHEHEYGFHRCPDCNENGLIRCPICCD